METKELKLDELFTHYGSDKTLHGYIPIYQSIFKNIKDKNLRVLEIGIGTLIPGVPSSMVGYCIGDYRPGGSLRAWRDYFKNSEIFGVDIQPDTQFTEDRITTYLCNSTEEKEVKTLLDGKDTFDIIIDDGSHIPNHQLATVKNLYPYLRKGGYYIIEDIYPDNKISAKDFLNIVSVICNDAYVYLYVHPKGDFMVISKY